MSWNVVVYHNRRTRGWKQTCDDGSYLDLSNKTIFEISELITKLVSGQINSGVTIKDVNRILIYRNGSSKGAKLK